MLVGVSGEGEEEEEGTRMEKDLKATLIQDMAGMFTTGRFSDIELYVHPEVFSLHR